MIFFFILGPVAAVFVNMYGCRIVTIVGACLAAAGFFLSRWWENIIYYYITIGAMGGNFISLGTFQTKYYHQNLLQGLALDSFMNLRLFQ